MKSLKLFTIAAATTLGLSVAAQAQSVAIGTSAQGAATYNIGSAIAKVAGDKTDLKMVVQPQGSTGKVAPLVNAGRIAFGLANILEVNNAVKGRGPFKGRAQPNLKVVAVIYPFAVGFFVRKDSPAKSVKDVKGLRVSSEYSGHRIIKILTSAMLANAGLGWDDVKGVPTVNIIGNANDFTQGKTDVGMFAVASGKVRQINAAVKGIRFLDMDASPEAVARMKKFVPPARVLSVKPRKGLAGVAKPTNLMVYDYLLYAGKHVPDAQVYKVAKMIAEQKKALAAAFGAFNGLNPKGMHKKLPVEYHPGAVKYYKEAGLAK